MSRLALALTFCACTTAPPAQPPRPAAALDAMDTRAPLPLLPMMALHQKQQMRGHLEAVQAVIHHLSAEDWAGVEAAALRLGTSPAMAQTCEHMGAAAPGFTDQALAFHTTADSIAAAARAHDAPGVLAATSATLQTCTTCHAAWRQQVVDDATWAELTAAASH